MTPSSATAPEPRWRRLPEERPSQIIEAALEVFGERGLASARLDDIARRAGVSKGTIYLYFPNKEALFEEMVRHKVISLIAEAEGRQRQGPPVEELRGYLRNFWSYLRTPQFATLYRLTIGELHHFPALMRFFVQEAAQRTLRLLSALIRRGVESGDFRPVDPDVTARLVHGLFVKHGVWAANRTTMPILADVSDDDVLAQLTDFVLHAIQASPSESAPRADQHA